MENAEGVYVLRGEVGAYYDKSEWQVAAYFDEARARAHKKRIEDHQAEVVRWEKTDKPVTGPNPHDPDAPAETRDTSSAFYWIEIIFVTR